VDDGIPVVMPQDMRDGSIVCERIARVAPTHVRRLERHILRTGDIVYSRRGDVTRFAVVTGSEDGWLCGTGSIRIRLNCPEIDVGYVRRYFQQPAVGRWLEHHAKGVTMQNLNTEVIRALPFVYPPLAAQRRISEILDKVDGLRAKRRSTILHLDTLVQAIFLDMFGDPATNRKNWATRPLGDVMTEVYRYPTYYDITYEPEGVPEIRGELLRVDGSIDDDSRHLRFISKETSARFPRTVLHEGDLVMSVRGTVGKTGLVPPSLDRANITANLIRLAPDRRLLAPVFASYFTRTQWFRTQLLNASSNTTISTIKAPDLKRIQFQLPPLWIQNEFRERVGMVATIKSVAQKALDELDSLFASLQYRAFNGEL
jgi:type I restriction enzyme S subunit